MQPNEQDPGQQTPITPAPNSAQPLPYAVPEYLHLDPVTGQVQKKSYKKLIVIVAAILVLIGITIIILSIPGYIRAQQEDTFYKALGSLMQTSYVHREITINTPARGDISVSADSDFSDPTNPKTHLTYNYSDLKKIDKNAPEGLIAGEITTIDNQQYVGRVTAIPTGLDNNLKLNQWYKVTQDRQTPSDPDIFSVYADANSTLTGVIIGNFASNNPDQILATLRASDAYTIESVKSKTQNGATYTVYSIKEDYQKLKTTIQQINTKFKTVLVPTTIVSTNNVIVTIADKTRKITEMTEAIRQGDFQTNVQTIYSYPENVSIKAPDGISKL